MREFFRPMRRKLGLVTLGLACVFIGVWIRSKNLSDSYVSPSGRSMCGMIFNRFGLELFVAQFTDASDAPKFLTPGWETTRIDNLTENTSLGVGINVWVWERFHFARFQNEIRHLEKDAKNLGELNAVVIPFWSIVLLLVLVSACLILDKSAARKLATGLRGYLKPWRRKIGAVALTMLCMVIGVWIRSQFVENRFSIPVGNNVHYGVVSIHDGICLHRVRKIDDDDSSYMRTVEDVVLVVIPYWPIAVPLAALAALLLLTKPRQLTPGEMQDPTAREGGATS